MIKHGTRIGVVMASHNRKDMTIECLRRLYSQEGKDNEFRLSVYLTDDGSTDGTAEAVEREFPEVHMLKGDGTLFWNGGMHLAFSEAMREIPDYYLWLNDDTFLDPCACKLLLSDYEKVSTDGFRRHIIIGTTKDPNSVHITYGGYIRRSIWHPFRYQALLPGNSPKPCDAMNGNCVLIAREVVELVGNLDPVFTHFNGDFDYALRARKLGCSIWVSTGYVGICECDGLLGGSWRDGTLPLRKRWAAIMSQKDQPMRERMIYVRRHGGLLWPIIFCFPYLKCVFHPAQRNKHHNVYHSLLLEHKAKNIGSHAKTAD